MKNSKYDYSDSEGKELARLVASVAVADGVTETNYPGLLVSRTSVPMPRQPVPYKPSLCIVVQGQKQMFLGDREFRYSPLQYLVVPIAIPLEMKISKASKEKPVLGLGLELDLTVISELLLDIDKPSQPLSNTSKNQSALYISHTSLSLQDSLIRLLKLLSNPTDLKILGATVAREIFYRVLQDEQGGQLRNMVLRDSSNYQIAELIGFLNENYNKELRIHDISKFAGMSDSTLHHKFREVTNMSPLQYLKKIRLHNARTMMVESGLNASEAGYQVGYSNPSQFSREFKRMFGLPPRQLLETMSI